MATRQYIGARYVPKFYQNSVDGSTTWEDNVVYEPLTYVTLQNGHMYISKKQVPATVGSPASNIDYWLDIGSYNGFIEELQNQINAINGNISDINAAMVTKANLPYLNVKDYGAKGDNVTDDSAAFELAIQASQAAKKPLYIPNGDYKIDSPIVLYSDESTYFKIFGEDDVKTVIRCNFDADTFDALFTLTRHSGATTTFHDIEVSNFTFISNTSTTKCFSLYYVNGGKFENLIIRRFKNSIIAEYSWSFYVNRIRCIEYTGTSENIRLNSQCNAWTFDSCTFSKGAAHNAGNTNGVNIIIMGTMSTINFFGCVFEFGRGIQINGNQSTPVRGINVIGCYFEWMTLECICCEGVVSGIVAQGCYFNRHETVATRDYAFRAPTTVHSVSLLNCICVRYSAMVSLDSGIPNGLYINNCEVTGNNIFSGGVASNHENNASAVPSSGYHQRGEFVWNNIPTGSAPTIGWICTDSGTPGTWVALTAN